jgi:hypothetical protein
MTVHNLARTMLTTEMNFTCLALWDIHGMPPAWSGSSTLLFTFVRLVSCHLLMPSFKSTAAGINYLSDCNVLGLCWGSADWLHSSPSGTSEDYDGVLREATWP